MISKKRKIETETNLESVLLPELLKEIFQYSETAELCQISLVCKHWYSLSQNVVGTVLADVSDFTPDWIGTGFNKQFPDINKKDTGPVVGIGGLKLLTTDDGYIDLSNKRCATVIDNDNEIVALVSLEHLVRLPCFIRSERDPFNVKFDPNPNIGWKLDILASKRSNKSCSFKHIVLKLYCDIRKFETRLLNGEERTGDEYIIRYAIHGEAKIFMEREYNRLFELKKPVYPFIPPKISPPKGLKEGFKFHRYQLEAISWMRAIENNIDKEFKYCDLIPWRGSRSKKFLVDLHNSKFVLSTKINEYIGSLKSKGGILADAVGLGKTLELIGLVLEGLSRSHENLPEFDDSGLINTKATLVICPNHLTMQWIDEIAKFTDLKVTKLTTADEIRTATYGDITSSAFVLIPFQTFKNKTYFLLGCGKKKISVGLAGLKSRRNTLSETLEKIKKTEWRGIAGPVLDHFNWPRIIVDEAHEVFNDPFACHYIYALKKQLAWYVSATPFPTKEHFGCAKKFLEVWEVDYESENTMGDIYEEFVENDLIASNLLWRNTKEGVQDEYTVPDYDEEIVLTEFSPIEAMLHKYGNREQNLQVCCGLLKPSSETFDTYKKTVISSTQESIAQNKLCYQSDTRRKMIKEMEKKANDFQSVPDIMQEGVIGAEFERLQLINNYGSKMTKLISWLKDAIKENAENRFILFSKYQDYLQKVTKRLLACDIPCVLMTGTGVQKNERLKKFKEEDIRVILLSLEKSASGLNLIEANHVVLLDPMDGTVEEARATEVQALGRAHRQGQDQKVTLVRFIIKDSVEEELYLRNKSTARETSSNSDNTNMNVQRSSSKLLAKSSSQSSLLLYN